jgi:hypothetical protein
MEIRKNKRLITKILFGLIVFISRFLPLPPNFSALGTYGFNSKNIILFFAVIIGYDFVYGELYKGIWLSYIGFAMYFIFGIIAKTNKHKLLLMPAASFSFFLISNLGVWLYWYPNTFEGLIRCYLYALPFFWNTLLSDSLFNVLVILYQNNKVLFSNRIEIFTKFLKV